MGTGRQVSPVREGDLLADKYRVEKVLGSGGMGVVVAARHIHLGQRVAVKLLSQEAASNSEAVARFIREARAAVRIQSDHVARVMDVESLPNGIPFMVMEYLVGRDLGGIARKSKGLPIEEAIDYVLQASIAIAEAHAIGIIHRDLKPSNMFLVRRSDGTNFVKILDFGISKALGPDVESTEDKIMTSTAAILGSPLYMSPEQMRSSKNVDRRTDIWSLGVILYEFLTGRPAYDADSVLGLCTMIATESTPHLRDRRPEIPEELEAAVMRCLEKDPDFRWQCVTDLALALAPFGSSSAPAYAERVRRIAEGLAQSEDSAPMSLGRMDTLGLPDHTTAPWGTTSKPKSRRRAIIVGASLGGALLALAVVGGTVIRTGAMRRAAAMSVEAPRAAASPSPQPSLETETVRSVGAQPSATTTPPAVAVPADARVPIANRADPSFRGPSSAARKRALASAAKSAAVLAPPSQPAVAEVDPLSQRR